VLFAVPPITIAIIATTATATTAPAAILVPV
jgi:hypothetical protein